MLKNELNENELNMVNGGLVVGSREYYGHVSKYDGEVGEKYYFVNDDNPNWVYEAILVRSGEEDGILWTTKRYHIIQETATANYHTIYGDEWTMYKNYRIRA